MAPAPRWLPLLLNAAAIVFIIVGIGSFVAGRRRAAIGRVATWGVAVALIQVIAFGFSATGTAWMIGPVASWAGAYVWSLVTGIQNLRSPPRPALTHGRHRPDPPIVAGRDSA